MKLSLRKNQDQISSDEISWIEDSKYNRYCVYSYKTHTITKNNLELPEIIDENPCFCILPNQQIFVYGNLSHDLNESNATGIAFYINPDGATEILPYGEPCYSSISAFHKNNIYIFGGFDGSGRPINQTQRFDMKNKSWHKITKINSDCQLGSCLEFAGNILITTDSPNSLVYDIDSDSYNNLLINGLGKYNKLVCKTDLFCYIIGPYGSIYESECRCLWNWKIVMENKGFELMGLFGNKIYHEDYYKFVLYNFGDNIIYKFNLKTFEIEEGVTYK